MSSGHIKPFCLIILLTISGCSSSSNEQTQLNEVASQTEAMAANLEAEADKLDGLVMPQAEHVQNQETFNTVGGSEARHITHAFNIISQAGHRCSGVVEAKQISDGSLIAKCDDGERYRIGALSKGGQELALKCSAMVELGMDNAC